VGNGRAVQDGNAAGSPDGYDPLDAITNDLAFCLDLPLGVQPDCRPAPMNDDCDAALPIFEGETLLFDTSGATTDGPVNEYFFCEPLETCCNFPLGDHQMYEDIWYDYTATCPGLLTVNLCDSVFDTRLAIYDQPDCPDSEDAIAACSDDSCGSDEPALQSEASLVVTKGAGYKIRVGSYGFSDSNPCYIPRNEPGCADWRCEAIVCTEEPSCCDTEWGDTCALSALELCQRRGASGTIAVDLVTPPAANHNLADYSEFTACFTGTCDQPPCDPPLFVDPCCFTEDFDQDGDVDLTDYEQFHGAWTGP
jgi:hypothetical protein